MSAQTTLPLQAEPLEAHIKHCGDQMQASYNAWERSGCFSDRAAADAWQIKMKDAIAQRTPEMVARLDHEALSRIEAQQEVFFAVPGVAESIAETAGQ